MKWENIYLAPCVSGLPSPVPLPTPWVMLSTPAPCLSMLSLLPSPALPTLISKARTDARGTHLWFELPVGLAPQFLFISSSLWKF